MLATDSDEIIVLDDDSPSVKHGRNAAKRKASRKSTSPSISFPLPPKFTAPLPVRVFDIPAEHENNELAYIRSVWNYSGPPHVRHFKDTGLTTDDLIGSVWIGTRIGLYTIVALQADKWGYPELIARAVDHLGIYKNGDGYRYFSVENTARLDDPFDERSAPPYIDFDTSAIYLMGYKRFDAMSPEEQHRHLSQWVAYVHEEAQRELASPTTTKYAKAFAKQDIAYTNKVLREFELAHNMSPLVDWEAKPIAEKPYGSNKRAIVNKPLVSKRKASPPASDLQLSLF